MNKFLPEREARSIIVQVHSRVNMPPLFRCLKHGVLQVVSALRYLNMQV